MKKQSQLVKSFGLIFSLLISTAVIIASCKKNYAENEITGLADLKNWETKNFNHNALLFNI